MMESNFIQQMLTQISTNEGTIIEFFAVFSRFEYSLKRAGYIDINTTKYVAADWNKFATDLNPYFKSTRTPQLKLAVSYLITYPPKRQISLNGELSWKNMSSWNEQESILKWLLLAVRRVRNNLFHGGKFPMQPVSDPTRDQRLLESSLHILEECLCLDAESARKVQSYFTESL